MNDEIARLEALFGGKLERKDRRVIPGSVNVPGTEFLYFSDDGKNSPRDQFRNVAGKVALPRPESGGVSERGCIITIPDGLPFHAIGYHGDIPGWRRQIGQGVRGHNLLTATIKGNRFVISDGREFPLSECKIEFC